MGMNRHRLVQLLGLERKDRMSSLTKHSSRYRLFITIAGSLLIVLTWATAASADWTTINTNDGQIDASWGDPLYSDACTNTERPADEIKNAWLKFDGTSIYLRIESCDPTKMLSDNTGQVKMRAVGAIDCNGNGEFDDPDVESEVGDRLIVYYNYTGNPNSGDQVWVLRPIQDGLEIRYDQVIQADGAALGTYSEEVGANLEWKTDISTIIPGCRASIAAKDLAWATAEVTGDVFTIIDQSTSSTTMFNPMDFGDLTNPDPPGCTTAGYPTRLPCEGARHGIVAGAAILGLEIDPNEGNLPNERFGPDLGADADDNDNTGSADDEDGTVPTAAFAWSTSSGGSLDITTAGGSGYVSCWIDWNNDKDLVDAGEKIVSDLPVSAGSHTVKFAVPSVPSGVYYARCRISPASGTTPAGAIYGGEVEDYRWLPQTATLEIGTSGASDAVLSWNEVSASDRYDLYRSLTPYFTPTGDPLANDVVDSPYTDASVLGAPPDVFFYRLVKVRTVDSAPYASAPSNEVGLFEYALSPGTP